MAAARDAALQCHCWTIEGDILRRAAEHHAAAAIHLVHQCTGILRLGTPYYQRESSPGLHCCVYLRVRISLIWLTAPEH